MRNTISILLGSGFSIPEGMPGVWGLNERLKAIDQSEILIHTEMSAMFLNGQVDHNPMMNKHERLFVQEFLKFYCNTVLSKGETFNYEKFYDYYSDYLRGIANVKEIDAFVETFNRDYAGVRAKHAHSWLKDFNRTFNQLLASQLQRSYFENDIHHDTHPQYENFLDFLANLIPHVDVKVHTLNHDMFFEYLGQKTGQLWTHFSDGYNKSGSPFYGNIQFCFNENKENQVVKHHHVRLERYINRFEAPLCLFKLHGSVMTHVIHLPDGSIQHVKRTYGMSNFYIEHIDPKTGESKLEWLWNEVDPDFLSGTTEKTRRYGDHYYVDQFDHFKKNLENSGILVVIGYGFQDAGINEYLERDFLSRGKQLVVIDPYKPQSELLGKYGYTHISKGVTAVTAEEFAAIQADCVIAKA